MARRDTASVFGHGRRGSDDSEIDSVLAEMRRLAHDSVDLGRRFERLCKGVLRALRDDGGHQVFDRVDSWDDWAGRDGAASGINLVAHRGDARGGDAVAVQCKCYSDSRLVPKRDVDPFLEKSGSASFSTRMLIHTAQGLSPDLQRQIHSQDKPCHVVDLAEMRRWNLDWWTVAEATGAVAPRQAPTSGASAEHNLGDADLRSAGRLLRGRASRALLSRGVAVAAIIAGTLVVFTGADIGVLLIIGGMFLLARRHSIRGQADPRSARRPRVGQRPSPRPSRWADDDGWDDDGDDDEWDQDDELSDEWDREDQELWMRTGRVPARGGRRHPGDKWDTDDAEWDSDDEWDRDDEPPYDEWDWDDDEPPRRSTARGHRRRSSWDTDDDCF